jgi:hypothetical protein
MLTDGLCSLLQLVKERRGRQLKRLGSLYVIGWGSTTHMASRYIYIEARE